MSSRRNSTAEGILSGKKKKPKPPLYLVSDGSDGEKPDRRRGKGNAGSQQTIDSYSICNELKDTATGTRNEEEFLSTAHYKEAFVQVSKAGRKGRDGKGNIMHHLVRVTHPWPEEELINVLRWLFKHHDQSTSVGTGKSQVRRPFDALLLDELGGQTAIHMALHTTTINLNFVQAMLKVEPEPKNLAKALCMPFRPKNANKGPNTGMTCLHYAIQKPSKDFHTIINIFTRMRPYFDELCRHNLHPLLIQDPTDNNTPLHLAVMSARYGSSARFLLRLAGFNQPFLEEDVEIISMMVDSCPDSLGVFNTYNRTPYQERIHCLEEAEEVGKAILLFQEILAVAKRPLSGLPANTTQIDGDEPTDDEERSDDEDESHNKRDQLFRFTWSLIRLYRMTNSASESNKTSFKFSGKGSTKAATQDSKQLWDEILSEEPDSAQSEEARAVLMKASKSFKEGRLAVHNIARSDQFRAIVVGDPIIQYLRNYCIRSLDREKVIQCLYPIGEDFAIDFNLAGISQRNISEEYLRSFENHLHFEATLSHVVLPNLPFDQKETKSTSTSRQYSEIKGRSDLTHVFKWLRKQNVKKIVKVTVFDEAFPCHTDAAIINCLKGFDVEVWNWKRIDLSSEVICESSSEVREISLYCSGNQTVLKGWSSRGGIGDVTKFPKLKKLEVFLREGQEDGDTLRNYGNTFKKDLHLTMVESRQENRKPVGMSTSHVDDKVAGDDRRRITMTPGFETDPGTPSSKRDTIEGNFVEDLPEVGYTIDRYPYGRLLAGGEGGADPRIAILDDGLDPSLDFLKTPYTQIEAGLAFYSSERSHQGDYYVPSGDHGSRVASLICSICPVTSLYIAKLESEITQKNTMQINTEAAAKAVRWAINRNVDIINMSWTIETDETNAALDDLKNAIAAAKKQGIIIFCSASDQGGDSKSNCYPRSWDKTCIGIGSLAITDTPSVYLNPAQIDFMFPGELITVQNNNGTSTVDSGSSYATAIATGVGGLLLYCTLVLDIGSTASQRTEAKGSEYDVQHESQFSWDYELMHSVFSKMSKNASRGGSLTRPEEIIDLFMKGIESKNPISEVDLSTKERNVMTQVFRRLKDKGWGDSWLSS
ncbi:hypothetical protein H9Q73_002635 [Fusarium xylarioides]|nr:hypothetical protein H9Q73_002635 [Fusarium xylarioides]